jgi:hypothetical protein
MATNNSHCPEAEECLHSWEDIQEYSESYRLILNDVVISLDSIEVLNEPSAHAHPHYHAHPHPHAHPRCPSMPPHVISHAPHHPKKYNSYTFRCYTPFLQWKISKRYNDFLAFHRFLETLDSINDHQFLKLLMFTFPPKHLIVTNTVITERKLAFQQYLEKAIKIHSITMMVVDFIELTPEMVERFNQRMNEATSSHANAKDIITPLSGYSFHDDRGKDKDHHSHKTTTPLSSHMKPMRLTSEMCLQRESKLLDESLTQQLFKFLPEISKTQKFQLCYSTWKHGWNLASFYENIGTLHPLILIIRSADQKDLFGAYFSTPVGPPSYDFKGNGDSLVFRLSATPVCYHPPPSGPVAAPGDLTITSISTTTTLITTTTINPSDPVTPGPTNAVPHLFSDLDDSDDYVHVESPSTETEPFSMISSSSSSVTAAASTIAFHSTRSQFIFANSDYIAIGGSSEHGSNAIRLSNDFLECSTGPSDTYGNEDPLVSLEPLSAVGKVSSVKVGEVEVFCMVGIFS